MIDRRSEDVIRVLILAPHGRDASVVGQVLQPHIDQGVVVASLDALIDELNDAASAAIVTEESLAQDGTLERLRECIRSQPLWSDFPFIVLATKQSGQRSSEALENLAGLVNQVLLERPLNAQTLISAVNSAVRSRRRQYQARATIEQEAQSAQDMRRLYDAERAARAEAEAANRIKDEFLATLSHELRTPLSSILGWLYVLQKRRDEFGDLAQGIDVIERNSKAQLQLVEDLLDMSKIVSGKLTLQIDEIHLTQAIEQVVATVQPLASAKKMRIQVSLPPVGTALIRVDPHRFQQIIWNLLTNSIKFSREGGDIKVHCTVSAHALEVSVTDSGAGISAEFLPFVFEQFRQADSSSTRAKGGLGLGLAIVKRLTELHGGSIQASSPGLGLGARFCLQLPIPADGHEGPTSTVSKALGEEAASPLSRVRILLVEDNDDGREMVVRLLSDAGADVTAVNGAMRALEVLSQQAFDLLVSDIGMPDIDGFEMLKRVRAAGYLIPAIALTAFARPEERDLAMAAGFAVHLSKPVDPPTLLHAAGELAGAMAA